MNTQFEPAKILVDKGFDADFSWERINEFCDLFAKDELIQEHVYQMHERDNALDLKRGEFYPELLRALISLKRSLSVIYGIDVAQIQPNFGSNGSIDTVLAAVKVEESGRLQHWAKAVSECLGEMANTSGGSVPNQTVGDRIKLVSASPTGQGGALFTSPTYFRNYNSANAKALAIHLVPLRTDYHLDTPAFVEAMLRLQPSIVFLVSPNNPTGLPIPDSDLCGILDKLPRDTWALIDRTLVNTQPEISTRELLQRYAGKNVVVLHSFSKYKGMSHLRIGVALYSNSEMAKIVQPHLPLGIGLEGCLKANRLVVEEKGIVPSSHVLARIRQNNEVLKEFIKRFPEFGFTDFSGNYCLLLLPKRLSAVRVAQFLQDHGLYVMPGTDFPEPGDNVIRLHTGGPVEYMKRLCSKLSEMTGHNK